MAARTISTSNAEGAQVSLSLKDVAVARAGRPVVAGVTFELNPGDAVIFKGPNGAGKTTLLRAIAGLLPVAAGRIELRVGGDAKNAGAERRAHLAHCGHADGVKSQLTVAENIAFWSKLYAAPRARVDAALRDFDLVSLAAIRAGVLSAGQRRRLGLSRLVIAAKTIWLLDEPTASIDAQSALRLANLIAAHRKAGGSAIIATHDKISLENSRSFVLEETAA